MVWCGLVWCGVMWWGVAWRGVEWSGVVWATLSDSSFDWSTSPRRGNALRNSARLITPSSSYMGWGGVGEGSGAGGGGAGGGAVVVLVVVVMVLAVVVVVGPLVKSSRQGEVSSHLPLATSH